MPKALEESRELLWKSNEAKETAEDVVKMRDAGVHPICCNTHRQVEGLLVPVNQNRIPHMEQNILLLGFCSELLNLQKVWSENRSANQQKIDSRWEWIDGICCVAGGGLGFEEQRFGRPRRSNGRPKQNDSWCILDNDWYTQGENFGVPGDIIHQPNPVTEQIDDDPISISLERGTARTKGLKEK